MAVASARLYASLHLAPDRQPRQHPATQFLQAGCPSCRPTNSIKALKAISYKAVTKLELTNTSDVQNTVKHNSKVSVK